MAVLFQVAFNIKKKRVKGFRRPKFTAPTILWTNDDDLVHYMFTSLDIFQTKTSSHLPCQTP